MACQLPGFNLLGPKQYPEVTGLKKQKNLISTQKESEAEYLISSGSEDRKAPPKPLQAHSAEIWEREMGRTPRGCYGNRISQQELILI